jgi:hypothetical protein
MSEQSQDTIDRNDPSIDPDGTSPSTDSAPAKSQAVDDKNAEPGEVTSDNPYVPDYEPEEKPQIQRSNPQPVTGDKDADIDTDGG